MHINPDGNYPRIDKTAYVAPTAVIIGNAEIGRYLLAELTGTWACRKPSRKRVVRGQADQKEQPEENVHVHKDGFITIKVGDRVKF